MESGSDRHTCYAEVGLKDSLLEGLGLICRACHALDGRGWVVESPPAATGPELFSVHRRVAAVIVQCQSILSVKSMP